MVTVPVTAVGAEPALGYGTDEAAACGEVEVFRGCVLLLRELSRDYVQGIRGFLPGDGRCSCLALDTAVYSVAVCLADSRLC